VATNARQRGPAFDRLPPQDIEAERSVLGAILLNPEATGAAIEILHDDGAKVFYHPAHQHIYNAVVGLYAANKPVDPVTLVDQLTRDGHLEDAGGVSYVSELSGVVPTSANVEYYANIVLDCAVLRRLITTCTNIASQAYERPQEVQDLLDNAENTIFALAETRQLSQVHRIGDLVPPAVERIQELITKNIGQTGLPTGFPGLDTILSGLQPSDMIVLAARPSVGKTAFALNIASHAAIRDNKTVLLFSLEMSKEQLVHRLLCMEGHINSRRLRSGFLAKQEFEKLVPAAGKLAPAPIFIDDAPDLSVLDLRAKARRLGAQREVHLIIIDYLQLMRSTRDRDNRQVEIAEISRGIKGIARELRVPVLALSQLSREAEKDDVGMPRLSHLRESGAIEQDADVVIMLSRPAAHKRGQADGAGADPDAENLISLAVAKQRNGPTGRLEFHFDRDYQRFAEITRARFQEEDHAPDTRAGAFGAPGEVDDAFDIPPEEEELGPDDEEIPF